MEAAMKIINWAAVGILASLASAPPAFADDLSKSILRPTPVTSGMVAGNLPGGEGSTSYYVAVDLHQGTLMTQLSVAGRASTGKQLTFDLLNAEARVAAGTYVSAGLDPKADVTKNFPIDSAGRYVIRLTVEGRETGTYCVLMGGTALPDATAANCPTAAAARPAPPPAAIVTAPPPAPPVKAAEAPQPPRNYEVIVSKCEERLRVGSDFLFAFDRADMRPEAGPTLDEIASRLAAAKQAVMIEGHTDAKGTDSYNQTLSEKRAISVRASLTSRGVAIERLNIRGYGKTHPVAPNERSDGTDDPDGRQKNRRVEVVVNTCTK
jgi:outer membrane protein OmpA-like peptidoglycan-associated protein